MDFGCKIDFFFNVIHEVLSLYNVSREDFILSFDMRIIINIYFFYIVIRNTTHLVQLCMLF